ncbi:MAG: DUF6686 family protein [Bacteroidota bacterium]
MTEPSPTNHQSNILYHGKKGYVTHCTCCQSFQIAFGNTIIYHDEQDYQSFIKVLETYFKTFQNKVKPNCRCIQINTPVQNFNLLFSLSELTELINILNKAFLVFQAERLANDQN